MKKASGKSNLDIIKDYLEGNRPFVQVGYVPPAAERHKDGDVWTDKDGIEWIQVGASKISKKVFETREATRQICPVCKRDISWSNNQNDAKFFNKTGKCYDCVIEEEHQMRLDGTFDTYEKMKVIHNQRSFLNELKQKIVESIDWMKNKSNKLEYLNSDGTMETWTDRSMDTLLAEAELDLKEVNKAIILCSESISMLEKEFDELKARKSADNHGHNKVGV